MPILCLHLTESCSHVTGDVPYDAPLPCPTCLSGPSLWHSMVLLHLVVNPSLGDAQSFLWSHCPSYFPWCPPPTDSLATASRWVPWMPYGNGGLLVPNCSTLPSSYEGIRVHWGPFEGGFFSKSLMRDRNKRVLCPCCFSQLSDTP